MSKVELSSSSLYVVRPSIVVFDNTEYSFSKTMDKAIMALPSYKLSNFEIYSIKANIHKLRKQEIVLEKKANRTELEELKLKNTKLTRVNLEKINLGKRTVVDHLKNIKHEIISSRLEKEKEKNINHTTHVVKFEARPEGITIATENPGILRDVTSEKVLYDGFGRHCVEGDLHVGVVPNDKILLTRYLWGKNIKGTQYNDEIENFVLALKPFYTIEEIMTILEQLKSEVVVSAEEKPMIFTLKKKSKQPIFMSQH